MRRPAKLVASKHQVGPRMLSSQWPRPVGQVAGRVRDNDMRAVKVGVLAGLGPTRDVLSSMPWHAICTRPPRVGMAEFWQADEFSSMVTERL